MKIHTFEYTDAPDYGWQIPEFELDDNINLFVGESGAGKTRLLNIFFNIASFAASGTSFLSGKWAIVFNHDNVVYKWRYHGARDEDGTPKVVSEEITRLDDENNKISIATRNGQEIVLDGVKAPKLASNATLLFTLKEEDAIKPIHNGFSSMMRRKFFGEDLTNAVALQSIPLKLVNVLKAKHDMKMLWQATPSLHSMLFLLHEYFKATFDEIVEQFKLVFPFVENISFSNSSEYSQIQHYGEYKVAIISEQGVSKPIPLQELSSGMQKVLLIITDIITCPRGTVYMIDEYENSLGINAIDFLPSFLLTHGRDIQLIMTSHHPSLINAVPVSNWLVFNRRGLNIQIKSGKVLEEKYGKSKQQKFIQLLNDPFYNDGAR